MPSKTRSLEGKRVEDPGRPTGAKEQPNFPTATPPGWGRIPARAGKLPTCTLRENVRFFDGHNNSSTRAAVAPGPRLSSGSDRAEFRCLQMRRIRLGLARRARMDGEGKFDLLTEAAKLSGLAIAGVPPSATMVRASSRRSLAMRGIGSLVR